MLSNIQPWVDFHLWSSHLWRVPINNNLCVFCASNYFHEQWQKKTCSSIVSGQVAHLLKSSPLKSEGSGFDTGAATPPEHSNWYWGHTLTSNTVYVLRHYIQFDSIVKMGDCVASIAMPPLRHWAPCPYGGSCSDKCHPPCSSLPSQDSTVFFSTIKHFVGYYSSR